MARANRKPNWNSSHERDARYPFNHCALVTSYGDIYLGHHWHQAITRTNVDFSSVGFCGIHQRKIFRKYTHKYMEHGLNFDVFECAQDSKRIRRDQNRVDFLTIMQLAAIFEHIALFTILKFVNVQTS